METTQTSHYRPLALSILAGFTGFMAVLTLWPSGWAINRLVVKIYGIIEWTPIAWLIPLSSEQSFDFSDLLNIMLFVPAAFLIVVGLPRIRCWLAVVASFLVSATIEAYQYIALSHREASSLDIITDTIGGLMGAVIGCIVNNYLAQRDSAQTIHEPGPPISDHDGYAHGPSGSGRPNHVESISPRSGDTHEH